MLTEADDVWSFAPPQPALAEGEVQVWRIPLEIKAESVARLRSLLSPDEIARAERFRFEDDTRRYLAAHAALRCILAGYLHENPSSLQFAAGERGKPFLIQAGAPQALCFNLSHSGELALLGAAWNLVLGIDLEYTRRRVVYQDVSGHFFAPGERLALAQLPADQQREAFFRCWTRKEAYLKAIGSGLARALDRFEVTLSPGEPARLLKDDENPTAPSTWRLHSLSVAPDYLGALAVESPAPILRTWHFNPFNS